jgi:PadR family transcriptional regulator
VYDGWVRLQTDTKALVLSVLAEGPKHGYGVAKAIRELSDGALKLGEGQLYPALHALEEASWVTAEWEAVGEHPRRIYSITPEGRAELTRRAARWSVFAGGVAKILSSVPLSVEASPEVG